MADKPIKIGDRKFNQAEIDSMVREYYSDVASPMTTNMYGGLYYGMFGDQFRSVKTHMGKESGPGSLTVDAHGLRDGFYPEPGVMEMPGYKKRGAIDKLKGEINMAAFMAGQSKRLSPDQKAKASAVADNLYYSLPDANNSGSSVPGVPPKDLARSLGSKTNEIYQLVNTACYAGGVKPDDWKKMFPNLTNLVQTANDQVTTTGAAWGAYRPKSKQTNSFTIPNHPGVAPLYNYKFSGTNISAPKPVTSLEDWYQ